MKHSSLLLTTVLILSSASLHAQQDTTKAESARAKITKTDTTERSENGFVGAPFAEYQPETGLAGGVAGLYYFYIHDDSSRISANTP